MRKIVRNKVYPALAVGGAVLVGMLEFVALQRSQLMGRNQPHKD